MRVSPEIESLVPYKPGKPIEETQREYGLTKICKLASNENPLGVSPQAVAAMTEELKNLHRYPDPSFTELREYLSQKWSWHKDHILVGNGSNELIDLLIRVFCEPGDRVLMPKKSFIAYGICAQAARVNKHEFDLDQDFRLKIDDVLDYIENDKVGRDKILFLANPNNPTGTYVNNDEMEELLDVCGGRKDLLIVIDEAYNEFVRAEDYPNSLSYGRKYKNVMILRTFSKVYGLAGLRAGVLLGSPDLLDFVHRVRNPFNVNRLAQKAVVASMEDQEYIKKSQQLVWDGLDFFYKNLKEMGLPYIESQGNFVLFNTLRDANEVFQGCLQKGVILRTVKEYKLPTYLRMNVGLPEENQMAMSVLKEVLTEVKTI